MGNGDACGAKGVGDDLNSGEFSYRQEIAAANSTLHVRELDVPSLNRIPATLS